MRISRGLLGLAGTAVLATAPIAGSAVAADTATNATPAQAAPPASAQDDFYALGLLLSRNLSAFNLSEREFRQVLQGFDDGYHQHPRVADVQPFMLRLQTLQHERQQQAGAALLAKIAALPKAHKTTSGLVYLPSVDGSGAAPRATDRVKVQYEGKLIDGTVFDSSIRRGEPATFPLGGIIPCWKEALQLMKVGGKARVICPASLAYGDRGAPPVIPPSATLDFQIELLDVLPPEAPAVPAAPGATGRAPAAPASAPGAAPH